MEGKRSNAKYCTDACRYEAFAGIPCTYCGQPANSRDHVIAKRMREVVELRYGFMSKEASKVPDTVPACLECNSIAGAKLFLTISAKRRYIQIELRRRYSKLLKSPNWTKKELDEIDHGLRSYIITCLNQKIILLDRISYRGKRVSSNAKIDAIKERKNLNRPVTEKELDEWIERVAEAMDKKLSEVDFP